MRPTTSPIAIFDHHAQRLRHERRRETTSADFLFEEASERLAERLEDVNRSFPTVLELGCRNGLLRSSLVRPAGEIRRIDKAGIACLIEAGSAAGLVAPAEGPRLVAETEAIPFGPGSFDAILSALSFHWTNDLPGALLQMRRALKPDGLLLASMLGGATLTELRQALMEAELEEEGGVSPRVSPFADLQDLGGLLQRAGFALPVVDSDQITVTYHDAFALMRDLREMGETNILFERRRSFTRRSTLLRAASCYHERFAQADGRIPATFEILTMTAWAPHADQPKPLRPGSATARLAEALGSSERSAGETTPPSKPPE